MTFKFTPEMFGCTNDEHAQYLKAGDTYSDICYRAQKALDEYLKTCPVVYGYSPEAEHSCWYIEKNNTDTHKAVLFNIEPIVKENICEHEPYEEKIWSKWNGTSLVKIYSCSKCGKELKPKSGWEEVE